MASSAFDAFNSNYYLGGVASDLNVLLTFNSIFNTQNLRSYNDNFNILEIDMSTGKIYILDSDSLGSFKVNEYDILTGTNSILGIVSDPDIYGLVTDAIGFDSNNGIIYYIGTDFSSGSFLISIPVRNPVFSWSKTVLGTSNPNNYFSSVNYDNVNNILFALYAEFDTSGNFTGSKVVEIDKITGEIIERGLIEGFLAYVSGSSSFDQNTGSFLLVGIDSANNQKMIIFNTSDNTFTTGYVPLTVSEIVCDNYSFAKNAYTTTSIREQDKSDFTIFPNPTTDKFVLKKSTFTDNSVLRICDINGIECLARQIQHPETEISTKSLAKGVYVVTIQNQKSTQTKKLIIQ